MPGRLLGFENKLLHRDPFPLSRHIGLEGEFGRLIPLVGKIQPFPVIAGHEIGIGGYHLFHRAMEPRPALTPRLSQSPQIVHHADPYIGLPVVRTEDMRIPSASIDSRHHQKTPIRAVVLNFQSMGRDGPHLSDASRIFGRQLVKSPMAVEQIPLRTDLSVQPHDSSSR